MNKPIVLAVLLLALAGTAWWRISDLSPQRAAQAPATTPPPTTPPDPSVASSRVEEVNESPDSARAIDQLLPRQSAGHAAGLHQARDELRLASSAVLVLDAASAQVKYGKNPDAVLPIASITKLMTALVEVEAKRPMDGVITITEDDVDLQLGSRSRMRVGTTLTRGEALRLALMSSENRAAHALARTSPAGVPGFVAAMNKKASQLGMTSTTFADPTGLDKRNQSTARDLATLVLSASSQPLIREFSTTPEHFAVVGSRILRYRNSDPLIKDPSWDIALQKTGYIIEAGHCMVLLTRMAGQDLVVVLLDAASDGRRSADARRIRRWVTGDNSPEAMAAAPAPRSAAKAQRKERAKAANRVRAQFSAPGSTGRKPARPAKN